MRNRILTRKVLGKRGEFGVHDLVGLQWLSLSGLLGADNETVTFHITPVAAGTYQLSFRYGAGNGGDVRTLQVNGGTATTLTFPGTGAWSSWSTITTSYPMTGTDPVEVTMPFSAFHGDNGVSLDLSRIDEQIWVLSGSAGPGTVYVDRIELIKTATPISGVTATPATN